MQIVIVLWAVSFCALSVVTFFALIMASHYRRLAIRCDDDVRQSLYIRFYTHWLRILITFGALMFLWYAAPVILSLLW